MSLLDLLCPGHPDHCGHLRDEQDGGDQDVRVEAARELRVAPRHEDRVTIAQAMNVIAAISNTVFAEARDLREEHRAEATTLPAGRSDRITR